MAETIQNWTIKKPDGSTFSFSGNQSTVNSLFGAGKPGGFTIMGPAAQASSTQPATGNYPTQNLQPGMTGDAVKQLQDYLVAQGYMTQAQMNTRPGYYGDYTTAAVKALQERLGVDNSTGPGYWGPRTIGAISTAGGGQNNQQQNGGKSDPDQPLTDEEYDKGLAENPVNAARIAKGNTAEMLAYAASSGDLSQLVNENGQPFSLEDQQAALAQGMEDNKLFYEAQQANDKANAEKTLADKQQAYQDYLISSGEQFQSDKTTLDQNASDTGMLFSTARNQKEKKLQSSYEQDQASKLGYYGRDVANTAQNYQYQYGNDAANGLSQYYSAGKNTYNPSVATGGVTSTGLSSIYNPSNYNYQGTQNVARKTAAQIRAANYLANKGNKLLSSSYNTQL